MKLTTTPAVLGLLAGAVVVAGLGAVSTTASADPASLARPLHSQNVFLLASINIGLFALILGMRSFTDEFRHGTIAWTLLSVRERWRVVAAKMTTSALAAAAIAVVALAVMVGLTALLSPAKGVTLSLSGADLAAAAGLSVAAVVWASLGVAVGALVRHQVAAVVGGLVWVLVVENLASGLLGDAGRFLPGQAAHAVANATAASALLPVWAAVTVLFAYLVGLGLLAAATLSRREVALAA
ncbi:MAG TPA: ABC transporter permease subunit [Acidimicrobiales bacterium]|nr:ABC transporter permease subunit [Acidimicrobiales bacterium]